MIAWADAARAALGKGPTALVTILATEGSVPRGAGTRMVVTADGIEGTIGGGRLELEATGQARAILALPAGAWRVQDYPLGPLLGQCCGGRVRLLVEHLADIDWADRVGGGVVALLEDAFIDRHPRPVPGSTAGREDRTAVRAPRWMPGQAGHDGSAVVPARGPLPEPGFSYIEPGDAPARTVLLFGAGHVGRAVARVLAELPFHLAWFDSRPDMAERPGVAWVEDRSLPDCIAAAGANAAILIVTHDHDLDYRLTVAALRSLAGFIGLIGSATKRARFMARLERDGFDTAQRVRVHCPIGLPGVAGKEPEVIAIAVAAQLLTLRGVS